MIRAPWLFRVVGFAQLAILLLYVGLGLYGTAPTRPQGLTLTFLLLPLAAVMPGLLAGRYRAMVWAALVDLFYLAIAITDTWSPGLDRGFDLGIAAAAVVGFVAAWWHSLRLRRAARRAKRSPPN